VTREPLTQNPQRQIAKQIHEHSKCAEALRSQKAEDQRFGVICTDDRREHVMAAARHQTRNQNVRLGGSCWIAVEIESCLIRGAAQDRSRDAP